MALADLVIARTSQDTDRLVDVFLELGVARGPIDRALVSQDRQHLVARYYGHPLGATPLGSMLNDAFVVIRRHHLRRPPNLALLVKTLRMSEGLAAQLDPPFNLTSVLVPYTQRLLFRLYSPLHWGPRWGQASLDAARLGVELPRQLRRITSDLERGGIEVGMRPMEYEPLIRRFERLANRIVVGIVAVALGGCLVWSILRSGRG